MIGLELECAHTPTPTSHLQVPDSPSTITSGDDMASLEEDISGCYAVRREKILNVLIDRDTEIPRDSRAAFYDFFRNSKTSHRNNGAAATHFSIEESLQLIEIVMSKEVGQLQKQYVRDISDVENKAFELKEKMKLKVKQSFMDMVKEKEVIKSNASREVTKLLLSIDGLKTNILELEKKHRLEEAELLQKHADETRTRLASETNKTNLLCAEREHLIQKVQKYSASLSAKNQECNALQQQCQDHSSRNGDLLQNIGDLKAEIESQAEKNQSVVAEVQSQLSRANAALYASATQKSECEITVTTLRAEKEQLLDTLFLAERLSEERLVEVQEEQQIVASLQQQLTCAGLSNEELNKANGSLSERVSSLEGEVASSREEVVALQFAVTCLKSELADVSLSLGETVTTKTVEVSGLQTTVTNLEIELSRVSTLLEETVSSNEKELADLERNVVQLEADLHCICEEKAVCEANNITLQQSVDYAVAQFQEFILVQSEVTQQHEIAKKTLADKLLMQEVVNRGLQSSLYAAYDELERSAQDHDESFREQMLSQQRKDADQMT